jgi:hypothetical protein
MNEKKGLGRDLLLTKTKELRKIERRIKKV